MQFYVSVCNNVEDRSDFAALAKKALGAKGTGSTGRVAQRDGLDCVARANAGRTSSSPKPYRSS